MTDTENRVTPLLEAEEAFTALERACSQAQHTIHLCYRIIDPGFPLLTGSKSAGQAGNWVDLLSRRARDGVRVRILMADFDEIFAAGMHREARKRFDVFEAARAELPENIRNRFEVLCVQHRARIGHATALLAWPETVRQVRQIADRLNNAEVCEDDWTARDFERVPEWSHFILRDPATGAFRPRFPRPHRVHTATHHEKLAVLDSRVCFVGGIDVCDRTYDDRNHTQDPAWHDIGYRIDGPAAKDAEAYFRTRWTDALGTEESFDNGVAERISSPEPGGGASKVQLAATRSVHRRGPFVRVPDPVITDIREQVHTIVKRAESFLYIENQFLRDLGLARAIAVRAREKKALTAVLLLPVVPIRSVEDGKPDRAALHGLALQHEAIQILSEAFGDRLGTFTLVQQEDAQRDGLDVVADSRIVYVHSKLVIADDRLAFAGSANFNGRSFMCDSELGFAWNDSDAVRDLRVRLWRQNLGLDGDTPDFGDAAGFPVLWRGVAERNLQVSPEERSGFVVPYPSPGERPEGRKSRIVPDALV